MSQDNIAIINRAYQAFARGDLAAVLELFADRLEHFGVVSDGPGPAPWHKPAHSRNEVAAYFETLLGALEPLKFEPQHLAAGGDYVYATTQQQFRVRKTGKMLIMRDGMHRFKVVDGRIVGWIANEDTAHTRAALDG